MRGVAHQTTILARTLRHEFTPVRRLGYSGCSQLIQQKAWYSRWGNSTSQGQMTGSNRRPGQMTEQEHSTQQAQNAESGTFLSHFGVKRYCKTPPIPFPKIADSASSLSAFQTSKVPPQHHGEPSSFSKDLPAAAASVVEPTMSMNKMSTSTSSFSGVTKSALLAQANNAYSRLMVHIQWTLHRGKSATTSEVVSAFISSLVMGNLLWVILGTTTFGLCLLYSLHYLASVWETVESAVGKEQHGRSIAGFLASSVLSNGLGVRLEFSKGSLLPEFKDGKLRFHDVSLSSKDTNFSFSGTAQTLDVSLSFNKWYEGKGLIHDLDIYGMQGKIYRRDEDVPKPPPATRDHDYTYHLHHDYIYPDNHSEEPDQPYHLAHVGIHDSFFEIYTESSSAPLRVSIFGCELPQLRADRVLLDFFNANNVSGAVNESMFTIHKRQDGPALDGDKVVCFKMNGINLGSMVQANSHSKLNWLVNGKAEVLADITLPRLEETTSTNFEWRVGDVVGALGQLMEFTNDCNSQPAESSSHFDTPSPELLRGALDALYHTFSKQDMDVSREYVIVNVRIKLSDLRASMPANLPVASSTGAPFVSFSTLRRLISFVNTYAEDHEKNPLLYPYPLVVKTTAIERLAELRNTTNLGQTRLVDCIVSDIYEDLVKMAKANENRLMTERQNSWSHSISSQLLLLGIGVIA